MPQSPEDRSRSRTSEVSIERLHQQLKDGIDAIETGEDWRAWLDFARHLHRYSFNNLVLIWQQRPDATSVASYRTWQSVHRQVRRGERALRVMAPVLRRSADLETEGKVAAHPEGKSVRRQQVVGFRPAAVFDISQTEGPPVPEPERPELLTGAAPVGLWDALASEVSERGYRLLRASQHELGGANGVTKVLEREVWVRHDVDGAQAVKTLAHELAHVLLHTAADGPAGGSRCAGVREVEAESVAHLVLAANGVATDDYSFPYVVAWAHPLAAVEHVAMSEIVARTGARVMDTARQLIDATTSISTERSPAEVAQLGRAMEGARRTADLRESLAPSSPRSGDREVLLAVLADSQAYFRRSARSSWVPEYLSSRGLGSALDSHELGHAPKHWTTLTDHLRNLGYTDAHIEAAGVATRAKNGHLIDHLRDRMTIPLRNAEGEVVGFTARINPMRDGLRNEPKYVNTPSSELFHKREILYGLAEHVEQLRAGHLPVLCEGPVDAIAVDRVAHEGGLPIVGLASIGTAFTQDQCGQLRAVVGHRTVCLAFDADSAGLAATEKAWRTLTEVEAYPVVVAALPEGSDPAALLGTAPVALRQCIESARPAGLMIAERKIAGTPVEGDAGRELMAFRQLADVAGRMPAAERSPYLLRVAELLHIDVGAAAIEVAQRHPQVLKERTLAPQTPSCRALGAMLRQEPSSQPADDNAPSVTRGTPSSRVGAGQ